MVVGVAPQAPPSKEEVGILGARYLIQGSCLLHFLDEETEGSKGEPCLGNGGQ